jgi:hypothetical protein
MIALSPETYRAVMESSQAAIDRDALAEAGLAVEPPLPPSLKRLVDDDNARLIALLPEMYEALKKISNGPWSQDCSYCGKTTHYNRKARIDNHKPDCPVAIADAVLTKAVRQ